MARPRSLIEFVREFPDEAACAARLIEHRWPDGFACPGCGAVGRAYLLRSRAYTFECRDCGRQTSVTAGTIMHKTKLPLTTWFWATHLVATHSNGMSALQLMDQLGVNEKTAWLLLHKLRAAMADRDREPLRGIVEVDQSEIPFRQKDPPLGVGGRTGMMTVIGAVEVVDRRTGQAPAWRPGRKLLGTRSGRVRIKVIPDNTAATLERFVQGHVAPGAVVLTDDHRSYDGLAALGFRHYPYLVGPMAAHLVLPWIHRVFALIKRWGLGTLHGFRRRHLDSYLEEWAFRFNRRRWRRVSFDRVLELVVGHAPHDQAAIIGHKPRQHRGNPPVRRQQRHRKTVEGMRQDGPSRHATSE
jgi:transposase-like protein/predicted RNA-binding Zn-ribbon protein involved in translation (DUF1610 family)